MNVNVQELPEDMVYRRILRLAGCGPECRLIVGGFDVDDMGRILAHVSPRQKSEIIAHGVGDDWHQRVADWIKALHAAESAFHGEDSR